MTSDRIQTGQNYLANNNMRLLQSVVIILILAATSLACSILPTIEIYGRVTTSDDVPVYNAIVVAETAGNTYVSHTSPFGYYSMIVPGIGVYVVHPNSKVYTFTPQVLVLPVACSGRFELNFKATN
jgi:TctA family transporter